MEKQDVLEILKSVTQRMAQYSVDVGHVETCEEDWTLDDLRKMANTLEFTDWSCLGRDTLGSLGHLDQRYAGRGEIFGGYIRNGILTYEDSVQFQEAISFVSKTICKNIGIKREGEN